MKVELGFKYVSYPTPVFCVGTYNADGRANLMTAVLGGMCSHTPPLFAVSLRPVTQTHGNISNRQAFTVNIPAVDHVEAVDYVGLVSGRDTEKFSVCGLTAVAGDTVDAPYVSEFPTVAECELKQTLDLGSHTMFIGEVVSIKGDEAILTEVSYAGRTVPGVPDIVKAGGITLAVNGRERCYIGLGANQGKAYSVGRRFVSE